MTIDLFRLTATEVLTKVKAGEISVEDYASSLLERIAARDDTVRAWAHLDPMYVIEQARTLDAVPVSDRGPLHGVAIAVKDVIFTKGQLNQIVPKRTDSILHRYADTVQLAYLQGSCP